MWRELDEVFTSQDTAADGRTTAIPATFLRVTARVSDVRTVS